MDSVMAGRGLIVFGFDIIAANPTPLGADDPFPINEQLTLVAETLHELFGKVLIAALVLHVVGALKHHFVDKDITLKRMLGSSS